MVVLFYTYVEDYAEVSKFTSCTGLVLNSTALTRVGLIPTSLLHTHATGPIPFSRQRLKRPISLGLVDWTGRTCIEAPG